MADDKPPSYDQAVISGSKKGEENSSFDGDIIHRTSTHEIPVVNQPETIEEHRTIRTSNGHTQIYVIQPSATNQAIHFRYPQNLYCDQCQRKSTYRQTFKTWLFLGTSTTRIAEAAHAPLSFLLCFTMFLCGCWPCCFIPFCCRVSISLFEQ